MFLAFRKHKAALLKTALAAVCLLAVLLSSCLSLLNLPEPVSAEPEYETAFYFGRAQLDELDGEKDHLVNAYDRMVRAMKAKEPTVEFSTRNPINVSEMDQVIEAVYADRSDLFWEDYKYEYAYLDDKVLSADLTVLTELTDKEAAFEEAVQHLLDEAKLSSDMSPVEQELALHDALCRHVTFNEDAAYAHSAYGAIVDGEAVCDGYSKAFQVLLRKVGIPSFVLFGTAEDEDGPYGHAWNLVRIGEDGYCYTDITWGDPSDEEDEDEIPFYAYFNRSLSGFSEEHTSTSLFTLPEGTEDWNYYRQFPDSGVEGSIHSSDTKMNQSIVAQIRKNKTARVYITDVEPSRIEEDVYEWFMLVVPAYAKSLGWENECTYGFSCLGREVHLYVGPPSKKNS